MHSTDQPVAFLVRFRVQGASQSLASGLAVRTFPSQFSRWCLRHRRASRSSVGRTGARGSAPKCPRPMPLNLSRPRASGNDTRTRRVPGTGKPKRLTTKGIAVVRPSSPKKTFGPDPRAPPGTCGSAAPARLPRQVPVPGKIGARARLPQGIASTFQASREKLHWPLRLLANPHTDMGGGSLMASSPGVWRSSLLARLTMPCGSRASCPGPTGGQRG